MKQLAIKLGLKYGIVGGHGGYIVGVYYTAHLGAYDTDYNHDLWTVCI